MSTDKHNVAVANRTEEALSGSERVFGNNSMWYILLSGHNAGQAYPFAIGPMECECTGLTFDSDNSSLFLSIQHPKEQNGIRQNMASETRNFELLATDGTTFQQQRQIPLGSN